jgi:hypothetical protein
VVTKRFSLLEMLFLRQELLQKCLDSRQAAEVLQVFLMGHGYGVSPQGAREAAGRVGGRGCSLESLQKELESLALAI